MVGKQCGVGKDQNRSFAFPFLVGPSTTYNGFFDRRGLERREWRSRVRYVSTADGRPGARVSPRIREGASIAVPNRIVSRKIYPALTDRAAAAHQQLRVIDESGEDYLYPAAMFAPIQLPRALRRAVLAAV